MKRSKQILKPKRKYSFKEGIFKWRFQDKAQEIGEELENIKETNGVLKPSMVIEAARNKNSPMHEMFEWDDLKAAQQHRMEFARKLISSIVIEIKYDDNKKTVQNVFYSVQLNPENANLSKVGYLDISDIMKDEKYRLQIIENALAEIGYWESKYASYQELSRIFQSIELTKVLIDNKKKELELKEVKEEVN